MSGANGAEATVGGRAAAARVVVEWGALDSIREALLRADGFEACGLLEGRRPAGRIEVVELVAAENVARSPEREFAIDPGVVVGALIAARDRGRGIVGVWHSHPVGPDRPSTRDLRELWPGWLALVSDGRAPARPPRAFRAEGGVAVELPLELPPELPPELGPCPAGR